MKRLSILKTGPSINDVTSEGKRGEIYGDLHKSNWSDKGCEGGKKMRHVDDVIYGCPLNGSPQKEILKIGPVMPKLLHFAAMNCLLCYDILNAFFIMIPWMPYLI